MFQTSYGAVQPPSPSRERRQLPDDSPQLLRHVVLLLFLCCSMAVGFCLCLWTVMSEQVPIFLPKSSHVTL